MILCLIGREKGEARWIFTANQIGVVVSYNG